MNTEKELPVRKREAMIEAHSFVATWITQAIASAAEGFADDETDSAKIEDALQELSARHRHAAQRMRDHRP